MRRSIKYQLTAVFLSLLIAMSGVAVQAEAGTKTDPWFGENLQAQMEQTARGLRITLDGKDEKILNQPELLPAGSSLSDWAAFALALAGESDAYASYSKELKAYVKKQYEQNGSLSDRKATEYHRIILTVLALGEDPENFGGFDLVKDGTYDYQGDDLGMQGINGWIFALISLDASGVEVPENAAYSREQMKDSILEAQNEDGSFGLMPGNADPDLTSMALQALAPYQKEENVQPAVERALAWLSEHMTAHGSFESYGEESAESCAQAVIALTALGIDPAADDQFTKEGVTLLDGLEYFRRDNGGYAHTMSDPDSNFMATEQVLMAQTALKKYEDGKGSLYDLKNYEGPRSSADIHWWLPVAGVLIVAGAGMMILFRKRGKTHA